MAPPQTLPADSTATSSRSKQPLSWKAVVDDSVTSYDPIVSVIDGETSVSIPEEIYDNAKPLWKNFILGHFVDTAPHIGKIHAIVNKIWVQAGSKSKIDVQPLSSTSFLFRIEDDVMRSRILKSLFWHIAVVPIIVYEWCPENAHRQLDLTSIPLWVDLKDVPGYLYSVKGLSFLGSIMGKPIKLHPSTKNCTRLDSARILIEVDLTKPLHKVLHVNGKHGVVHKIQISYPWVPPKCTHCSKWGHVHEKCSSKAAQVSSPEQSATLTMLPTSNDPTTTSSTLVDSDVVDNNSITTIRPSVSEPTQSVTPATWTVVPTNARAKSSSPTTRPSESAPVSPSRFALLSNLPEEGEIQDDDDVVEDDLDPFLVQEKDFPVLSIPKAKNRGYKQPKKVILNKKDMILASTQSANTKRASSRKH